MRNNLLNGPFAGRQNAPEAGLAPASVSLPTALLARERKGILQSHSCSFLPMGRVPSWYISHLIARDSPVARTHWPGLWFSSGLLVRLHDFIPQPAKENFPRSPCTKVLSPKKPKASFKRRSWVLTLPQAKVLRPGTQPGPQLERGKGRPVRTARKQCG